MRCLGILAVSAVLLAAGASMAGATPVGDADIDVIGGMLDVGSWGQQFLVSIPGSANKFDSMVVAMTVGSLEQPPAFRDLSAIGWMDLLSTPIWAEAAGPETKSSYFTLWFTGDYAASLSFELSVFSGENVLSQAKLRKVGDYWTIEPLLDPATDPTVPEPVTMAGLMMGIGGLVTYVRKRRKA
jgi:hypothetical protein